MKARKPRPAPGPAGVSIRDVARSAGVALSSVSRVLNGSPHVSEALRRRVDEAVARLDFRPNAHARGLRAARSMTLGLILRDVANTTFATLWKAAVDAAAGQGYRVLVTSSETSREKEIECVQLMLQQQVDGVVGFVADESRNAFRDLAGRLPLVLVESQLRGLEVDRVLCGNLEGAREAAEHLLARGHRRIVLLAGAQSRVPGRERRKGFEAAFRARGLKVDPALVFPSSHLEEPDRVRLRALLAGRGAPTALFAATAHLTLEALAITRELGIRIPEQLSFVGFDNRELASLSTPPLTTVERDVVRLGAAAVSLLIDRIRERGAPPRTVTVPTVLVPRASVRDRRAAA